MPPQPGMFALPYTSANKARATANSNGLGIETGSMPDGYHASGSSRAHQGMGGDDSSRKERKRKEIAGKLGKEMSERRDDGRHYTETISALVSTSMQIASRPETLAAFTLRLYPLSLERSALLAQLEDEERHAMECAQTAYDEERDRVEDEWQRGRARIRERLLEGIEERRRRAREEKEGEGIAGDATLDSQSRSHITRKLRNKLGTSPPPVPHASSSSSSTLPTTTTLPPANPHSLAVDELPSPYPLPLTSMPVPNGGVNGRRRAKGGGTQVQALGGLGKALALLTASKEHDIESDLGDIRRGNKRRRATAASMGKSGRPSAMTISYLDVTV